MSVADEVSAAIARDIADARVVAEGRMRGTVRIERLTGPPVTDPDTGEVTHARELVYEGGSRSHYTGTPWPETPDVGESLRWRRPVFVSIPFGPVIRVGDHVTILTDPDTPQIVGNEYRVVEPGNASQETAQRVLCHDTGDRWEG